MGNICAPHLHIQSISNYLSFYWPNKKTFPCLTLKDISSVWSGDVKYMKAVYLSKCIWTYHFNIHGPLFWPFLPFSRNAAVLVPGLHWEWKGDAPIQWRVLNVLPTRIPVQTLNMMPSTTNCATKRSSLRKTNTALFMLDAYEIFVCPNYVTCGEEHLFKGESWHCGASRWISPEMPSPPSPDSANKLLFQQSIRFWERKIKQIN